MNFLYIGDLHLRENQPASRTDDYTQTLLNKIYEIKSIAKNNNCIAILQGGDFLNVPKLSDESLIKYMNAFSDYNINRFVVDAINGNLDTEEMVDILKTSTPLIGVVGNHELFGETMKSYSKTSLHFLEKIGFMNLVTKDKPIIFEDKTGFKVAITGSNYSHEIDLDINKEAYIIDKKIADYQIHIIHGMMLEKANKMYKSYTLTSDIIDKTEADITLCGHYHDGFKTLRKNNKFIANSGAIVRQTNRKSNVTRKPKVLLIDIDKENGITIKSINLKSALPAEKVFDFNEKAKKATISKKLEEIKEKVEKANVKKGNNITEIVKNIATNKNIKNETKNELVSLLSNKMKDMNTEIKDLPQYKIKKLILENFQSHEYSEFEFSDGLNILTGESGTGKTSIIRALSWIYENSMKNARRYIRTDTKFCKATIVLSNEYEISRIVEESPTKGFNGYEIYYPDTQERKRTNTKELPIIQELLGFSKLIVDNSKTSKDIPINFLKQGSPWFFVGDGNTAPERAKIIGSIYGTQYADSLAKDLEQEHRKNNTMVDSCEKTSKSFILSLKRIPFVDEMNENLKKYEKLLNDISVLNNKKENLILLQNKARQLQFKKKQLTTFIKDTEDIVNKGPIILENLNENQTKKKQLINKSLKIKNINEKKQKYIVFYETLNKYELEKQIEKIEILRNRNKDLIQLKNQEIKINNYKKRLDLKKSEKEKLMVFLNNTNDIEKKLEVINNVLKYNETKTKVLSLFSKYQNINKTKNKLNTIIKNSDLDKYLQNINNVEILLNKRGTIINLKEKGSNAQANIKKLKEQINIYNTDIQHKKEDYAKLLEEAGHCPICSNKIEVENIPNIIEETFKM